MLVVALILSFASISFAADPACLPQTKTFKKYGVRIRGIYIMPDEKTDAAVNGLVNGLTVDDAVTPELDLEYFFTQNFSTELVLALSKHDIMFDNGGVNDRISLAASPFTLCKIPPDPYRKNQPLCWFRYERCYAF